MSDLVLYTYFRSSSSQRVRIALHAKKLKFESQFIHLLNDGGQQHAPEYKTVNPSGQVPTLVHQGKALAQSMAIIQYLDIAFPQIKLFPEDAFLHSKTIEFCEIINSNMQPFHNLKLIQHLEKELSLTASQKQKWFKDWMNPGFIALEKIARKFSGTFCFGDSISAADCFLAPQITAAERFEVDLSPFPRIKKISESYPNVEAFKLSHPFVQPDCPPELRARE